MSWHYSWKIHHEMSDVSDTDKKERRAHLHIVLAGFRGSARGRQGVCSPDQGNILRLSGNF